MMNGGFRQVKDCLSRREFLVNATVAAVAARVTAAHGDEYMPGAVEVTGDPRLDAAKRWFREAQYGMFVHWGVHSLISGEWKGRRLKRTEDGCWSMLKFEIPIADYERVASTFNPVLFNADEIVQLARDAGMKYIVFTSKHHDGFAMFRSKVSKFNVVDATAAKRDIVEEMAEACRKHEMKFCLYYSHDLDWHEKDGGCYEPHSGGWARFNHGPWCNYWDFPDPKEKDFRRYFEGKALPQIEEILTQYGDIGTIWYDMGYSLTREQVDQVYDLTHRLQPLCLVKIPGNGKYDFGSTFDNNIAGAGRHETFFEVPCTLNDTWGYIAYDQNWKSVETIKANRDKLMSQGVNYLLNIGPDALGRIPAPSAEILRNAGI